VKIAYYPDTDSMYIDLSEKPSKESREVSPGVVLDYDEDGNIAGIDIDNASGKLNLKELVFNKVSVDKQTIAAWLMQPAAGRLQMMAPLFHREAIAGFIRTGRSDERFMQQNAKTFSCRLRRSEWVCGKQ
jgi:uncharacterized protein YuzE